jgi:hypothetical protein
MPFSISRPVFNLSLPHNYHALTHPIFLLPFLPFCCMEQRRMHSQQLTRNPPDPASFDNLPSPFYPGFLEQGNSKVTQAPHHAPPYVQRPFAPDSGAPLEDGGSPPLFCRIHEQPQQAHSRFPPPSSPQHYPLQLPVPYPLQSQHDNERHNPTHQELSHQLPRPPSHPAYMTWVNGAFPNNASPQPMPPRGIPPEYGHTYPPRQDPVYPLTAAHHPAPTHSSPEQPTMTQGPSTLLEQHEDRVLTDHGQRCSWGGATAGSLDPTTGVFSRASDHPRIRTAQACEKCRARKAKVSISSLSRSPPYPASFIF